MERSYWTHGSKFLCIRTDTEGKANLAYERVAQAPEVMPGDDPQYSGIGDWEARAEQITRVMNAHDDLVAALEESQLAISYAMRGTADAEQSDKYASTIRKITEALAKAKGDAA